MTREQKIAAELNSIIPAEVYVGVVNFGVVLYKIYLDVDSIESPIDCLEEALEIIKYKIAHVKGVVDVTELESFIIAYRRAERVASRNGAYRRKINDRRRRYDS